MKSLESEAKDTSRLDTSYSRLAIVNSSIDNSTYITNVLHQVLRGHILGGKTNAQK
jgi:hypothetical protein